MRTEEQIAIEAFVRLVRAAEALDNCINRQLIAEGLTPSQFSTLRALRIEGPLAQRDIAKHLLKSGANITMVVDNLEREGLVHRDRDLVDRRLIHVSITDKGREVFDRLYPSHLQRIVETMDSLEPSECRQLAEMLNKLFPDHVVIGRTPATMADSELEATA